MTGMIAEGALPRGFLDRERHEAERAVLKALGRCDGEEASFGEIAGEAFRLSRKQSHGALTRLHERGVLDRRADPDDRRRTLFRVSDDLGGVRDV